MKFEGAARLDVVKKQPEEDFDLELHKEDRTNRDQVSAENDSHEDGSDSEVRQQAIADRLEARAFSKEHSAYYRKRLAGKIWDDRRWLKTKLEKK